MQDSPPKPLPKPVLRHYPPAVWSEAKRLFVQGLSRIPEIALLTGINRLTLIDRLKRERWYAKRRDYLQALDDRNTTPPPPIPVHPPQPQPIAVQVTPASEEVAIIDKQMTRLNSLLDKSKDPLDLDRLASALTKLSERKRILLGIPLPGSQRPSRKPVRPLPPAQDVQMIELHPPATGQ